MGYVVAPGAVQVSAQAERHTRQSRSLRVSLPMLEATNEVSSPGGKKQRDEERGVRKKQRKHQNVSKSW